jgi:hypothetical protein
MTEDKLFEQYLDREKKGMAGFFKNPKSWVILVSIIVGAVLVYSFYQSVIMGGMSREEVKNSLEVVWHDTQWVDKKVTPQEIKIVPCISIKVKNVGQRPLQYVDINAVFEFEESGAVFDDGMARLFKEPLNPGETSEKIVIKSSYGYSASSRGAFMENKDKWKKMQAKLFARAKGSGLVRIGGLYPIKQEIEGIEKNIDLAQAQIQYANEDTRELAQSIQVVYNDSMWVDRVVTAKEVIIVPSITIEIKNIGKKPVQPLYFKGIFKYEDTGEVLSEGLTPAPKDELAPEQTSKPIQIKADFGYSASSKEAFVKSMGKWRQLKVNVYVKNRESDYALLGIYPISKKIQGVKVVYHYQ